MRRWIVRAVPFAAALLLIDAFLIEPFWLETTYHTVQAPVPRTLRIAHLSDLHTHGLGRLERSLIARLEAERPDLIVISGDNATVGGTLQGYRSVLSRLHAPLGVWCVPGNWEHWLHLVDEHALCEAAGIHYLCNRAAPVLPGLWLAGFDDAYAGRPDLAAGLRRVPRDATVLGLFHAPVFFDQLAGHCALAFAGHTHGGQVRMPLVGAVLLPRGSGRYVAGWYTERGSRLYVSRGIGTSILPARFLCRPELAMVTIEPTRRERATGPGNPPTGGNFSALEIRPSPGSP